MFVSQHRKLVSSEVDADVHLAQLENSIAAGGQMLDFAVCDGPYGIIKNLEDPDGGIIAYDQLGTQQVCAQEADTYKHVRGIVQPWWDFIQVCFGNM
jgi:hypothetical protein